MRPKKLAVLFSGEGSLFDAIADSNIPIYLTMADRPCPALDKAADRGLAAIPVFRSEFLLPDGKLNRPEFTERVRETLSMLGVDLIALAGYMTLFDDCIFDVYPDNILNMHPSLLPAFPGGKAVADALRAGVSETGTTLMRLRKGRGVDQGDFIAQVKVPVLPGDTEATLHERIKVEERKLYVKVLKDLMFP